MPDLDLATAKDVLIYLENTPFRSHSATPLTGGFGNYAYRICLQNEYQGKGSYVLKHGKPYIPGRTLKFSLDRQVYEVEALRQVKAWLPSDSLVTVPEVHLFDKVMNVIIMSDCGEGVTILKEFLLQETPIPSTIGTSIGSALGKFIGELHTRGKEEAMLARFEGNTDGRELSVFVTYGRTLATLRGDNVPPALQDPLLDIPQETLDAISAITQEMTERIITTRETVVMGDFWPGNVLVDAACNKDGDLTVRRLYVIDWEMAKPGLAGLDIGQFCAELELLRVFSSVNGETASETRDAFCRAYRMRCGRDLSVARTALVHVGAHLATLTPRNSTWTGKGKDRVRKVVQEGIRYLVDGKLASEEYISRMPVSGLLTP